MSGDEQALKCVSSSGELYRRVRLAGSSRPCHQEPAHRFKVRAQ